LFYEKGRGDRENGGGVNLIKIYCKHICKCYNIQLLYANRKEDDVCYGKKEKVNEGMRNWESRMLKDDQG
jgi:hypothetical protein